MVCHRFASSDWEISDGFNNKGGWTNFSALSTVLFKHQCLTIRILWGWAFLSLDKLLSHALILDLPTYRFFWRSLPHSSSRVIYFLFYFPHPHPYYKKRHCRAEIPQVLANGIPRVYEPLRGSRDLIAPAGVRSNESVPFNQIQNEFSALFTRLSPGLQKSTREQESH